MYDGGRGVTEKDGGGTKARFNITIKLCGELAVGFTPDLSLFWSLPILSRPQTVL